ncbi:3'-5' exonuclease [Orrella daihaiensis]|uniref:3'-5' exonuclease n=1 Tax=Orrella daihaiensis TaxID=2782176 RepID=A0ABY4ALS5_9BURK|nr:3'-5' exonuclease [Orrella daihaiensis]UOD50898.1 3'-5' exonuclease [Orrella daihaiensis]
MFDKLFGRSPTPETQPHADAYELVGTCRWVVVDTETTGLNIRHDRIISIAAVAVHLEPDLSDGHIPLADTFEAVIHQAHPKAKKDNILIHHIGVDAQGKGHAEADVLGWFVNWVGDSPIFAYHAPFDKAMIANALKHVGMPEMSNPWVDVQPIANWVTRQSHALGLDECVEHFGLESIARHSAASDTFVTAELLLKLLRHTQSVATDFKQLQQLASQNATRIG